MDDLYKNLKIYEAEVMGSSSTSQNIQNVAFVSSNITGSTNEAVKTAHGVSTANSKDNASTLLNVDSLSDAVIYSFFASQSNSSQLDNEDLKQIDPNDLEEIDLKWQMVMLIMRAMRFLKKTGRNLGVNGTDTIGFDKTKVECYNCHIRGHFVRECRAPKHQDNRNREITRRTMPVEETIDAKALVAQDGFGYDWSDQAEEGPANFALMAYTSSSSSSSDTEVSTCSKACLKSYETLKEHYDNLTKDFNMSQLNIGAYKAELRKKFEKAKKERDDLKLTLEKFENSSKNLSKLLDSQVSDKFKTGVGYDSQGFDSQDEYVFSESVTSVPAVATSEVKTSESKPKSVSEPLIEDWISDSENENETEFKSKQRKPSFAKVEFVKSNEHVKSPRESVNKVENNKQAKYTSFNHLIKDCDFYEKKMVEKPVWNNARRVNHQNSQRMSHPHPKRNFVPKAVLMKSSLKTLNTARQNSSRAAVSVNTARPINTAYTRPTVNYARPASNVFNRAHSHVIRHFNKFTTNKNSNFNEKVNTVKGNVTTVRPKAAGNPQLELQQKRVIDSGCSRHMTGNKSYLSNYEKIDGGFVAFGDDYSRFSWVFFLATKDETSGILKAFITGIENLIDHKVKIIRCYNGTEFKNKEMNQFCEMKGIKREFSVARTPQQNGVAERKNRTLIEAARTMLAVSKLHTTFWAEAVNTACYVKNRVLVIKPHNKTPYELFHGRTPSLSVGN
ncbi:ribonuclease H-like domain-containing protein [Tanacetum coccineum]